MQLRSVPSAHTHQNQHSLGKQDVLTAILTSFALRTPLTSQTAAAAFVTCHLSVVHQSAASRIQVPAADHPSPESTTHAIAETEIHPSRGASNSTDMEWISGKSMIYAIRHRDVDHQSDMTIMDAFGTVV
jgi:DNA-binding transcriptional regulator YdaS (Cro superfamily)